MVMPVSLLSHWGRVTHICVGKLIIIGSDNCLSPDRQQAIVWTNVRLLSIGPLRTYFNENLIKIQQFSLKKMHVKRSSAKWRPSCLSLNVLGSHSEASHPESGVKIAYRKVSNIRRTRISNKIVDHSDEVGASPVGAAPTPSSLST